MYLVLKSIILIDSLFQKTPFQFSLVMTLERLISWKKPYLHTICIGRSILPALITFAMLRFKVAAQPKLRTKIEPDD